MLAFRFGSRIAVPNGGRRNIRKRARGDRLTTPIRRRVPESPFRPKSSNARSATAKRRNSTSRSRNNRRNWPSKVSCNSIKFNCNFINIAISSIFQLQFNQIQSNSIKFNCNSINISIAIQSIFQLQSNQIQLQFNQIQLQFNQIQLQFNQYFNLELTN